MLLVKPQVAFEKPQMVFDKSQVAFDNTETMEQYFEACPFAALKLLPPTAAFGLPSPRLALALP